MKKQKNNILIAIATCILIIANIVIYVDKIAQPTANNKEIEEKYWKDIEESSKVVESQDNTVDNSEEELLMLQNMGEQERMQFYVGKYFSYIEKQEYDKAYELLYPEFKETYFNTFELYEEYVKKTYPKLIILKHNEINRQGYYYILSVTISDLNNSEKEKIEQKFVLKEETFNDFKISFQVK